MKTGLIWLIIIVICPSFISVSLAQKKKKVKNAKPVPQKIIIVNKLLEVEEYYDQNFRWFKYQYDNNENLVDFRVDKLRKNTLTTDKETHELYTYDVKGNKTSVVTESGKNGGWVVHSKCFWEYDDKNNDTIVRYKGFEYSVTDEINTNKNYDKDGRLISYVSDAKDYSGRINTTKEFYQYDDKGLKQSLRYESYENGIRNFKSRNEYKYDTDGRMISNKCYQSVGTIDTTWYLGQVNTLIYDVKGNVLTDQNTYYDYRNTLISIRKITSIYDSLDNKLTEISVGNDYKYPEKNEFVYDSLNRRIKKICYNLIGSYWQPVKKTEYEYDKDYIIARNFIYADNQWKNTDQPEKTDFGFMKFEPSIDPYGSMITIKYFKAKVKIK